MTLHIPISAEIEAKLREKAAAAGQDLSEYAASVLERLVRPPQSLREISGPLGDEFAKSGMTDDELGDLLDEAKHRMRRERGPT